MNSHLGLIHSILPATADLKVKVPKSHPSARNLGSERMGSGTIVDPGGYILTVHYVTLGAESIEVTLADGQRYPGQLAAQDFETGLALVRIPARDLPFLKPAPPGSVSLGQEAVIIASTGEAGRKVSGGYVTSFEGFDGQWEYMLEKSIRLTAFNPGFGGGTLADFKGRLIGVVSLNLNEVGKFSLAIPIEYYAQVAEELKAHGRIRSRVPRPWFGLHSQLFAGHVVVTGVVPGGPADKSGLREGDVIISVEQNEVRSRSELYREIWKKRPGERVLLRVLRDDESLMVEVIGEDRSSFYRS